MNQVLKDAVYQMGTMKQLHFLADIGGMNGEETHFLELLHSGKTDLYIQTEMGLSRSSYRRIEEAVRAKLLLAVFESINHYMEECIG